MENLTIELRTLVDEWLDSGVRPDGSEIPTARRPGKLGVAALHAFWSNNQPSLRFIETGETELFIPSSPLRATDAQIIAAGIFSHFMDEPKLKERIAKCRRTECGIYYFNRKRLSEIYQRGTYCEHHRSKASAERSVNNNRKYLHNKLIEFAMEAWALWETKKRREEKVVWIAKQINRRLSSLGGSYPPIKRNWVTRHESDVLEELAKRKSLRVQAK